MTSWIIINKRTGRKIFETYSEETAKEVREQQQNTLLAIPASEWPAFLNELRRRAKKERFTLPKNAG